GQLSADSGEDALHPGGTAAHGVLERVPARTPGGAADHAARGGEELSADLIRPATCSASRKARGTFDGHSLWLARRAPGCVHRRTLRPRGASPAPARLDRPDGDGGVS